MVRSISSEHEIFVIIYRNRYTGLHSLDSIIGQLTDTYHRQQTGVFIPVGHARSRDRFNLITESWGVDSGMIIGVIMSHK